MKKLAKMSIGKKSGDTIRKEIAKMKSPSPQVPPTTLADDENEDTNILLNRLISGTGIKKNKYKNKWLFD